MRRLLSAGILGSTTLGWHQPEIPTPRKSAGKKCEHLNAGSNFLPSDEKRNTKSCPSSRILDDPSRRPFALHRSLVQQKGISFVTADWVRNNAFQMVGELATAEKAQQWIDTRSEDWLQSRPVG